MKKDYLFGFHPNGTSIPMKLALIYLILFATPTIFFYVLGFQLPAVLVLCIGLAVYVMTDVLLDQRNHPNITMGHKVHGVVISCLCGAAVVICGYHLIRCFVA